MGLSQYGVRIGKCKEGSIGPRFTRFLVPLEAGERISRMENLERELALLFKVDRVRITAESGRSGFIGVEVPNAKERLVFIREAFETDDYKGAKGALPITLGLDQQGRARIADLAEMPHLLIAGATGSGKSVFVNVIILSLLYRFTQDYVRFLMVDLKRVELEGYGQKERSLPHLLYQVMTTPDNAVIGLRWAVSEMEARYQLLAQVGARHISGYNQKMVKEKREPSDEEHPVFSALDSYKLPYLIIIIDELGDLMSTQGRKIEVSLTRLAQMSRAIGIHLIVATQRPSVDVITGVIKANFPVRIAYQVASKIDSRTILDMGGADQLLRNGDMLYLSSSTPKPIRIQNAYISTEECEKLVEFISNQKGYSKPYLLPSVLKKRGNGMYSGDDWDEMFPDAARLILKLQNCSTSTLQRRLKLGYARAARIVDQMEEAGIVGPNQGAKGREILITEDELEEKLQGL